MSKEHKPPRLVKRNKTLTKKTKEQKETLLVRLAKYPILQTACDSAGIGRSTYYLWRQHDKKFRKRSDDASRIGKEFMNDVAESQLIKTIQNLNMTGIIFWLKNHHPDYCEKITHKYEIAEPEVTDEQQIQIGVALHNIGMASIIRSNKRIREEVDRRIEAGKQKQAQWSENQRNNADKTEKQIEDPEDTIIKMGNAKPITVREHLDRYEERKRTEERTKEKAVKDRGDEKNLPKRTGVDLKEFFKKYPPESFKK